MANEMDYEEEYNEENDYEEENDYDEPPHHMQKGRGRGNMPKPVSIFDLEVKPAPGFRHRGPGP